MTCLHCNQPIIYTDTGIVHADKFLYCADKSGHRATRNRGPFLVRQDMGIVPHTPTRDVIKYAVIWVFLLCSGLYFRFAWMVTR